MPDQSSNRATLRLDGHQVKAYAAFFTGAVVLTGTVSATPASYPVTSIAYTTSTGSSANVRRGYRVIIKTSGGLFKVALTVRNSGTISSTALPIRESAKGTVDIVAGDLIEVRSVMQPGDKLTTADASFSPDGLVYSDQNEEIPPVCCSGGPFAAIIPAGFSAVGVDFDGTTSYTLDEDSGGDLTHEWSFPTATGTTTSSSSNPTFTFPVGEHVGTHTVTDDDNGASATQVISGKVTDSALTGVYEIAFASPLTSDLQNGASCTLELFQDGTLTDIPDGTLCIVFMAYTIGGTAVNFGSAVDGHHNILMSGYTSGDTFAYGDGLDTLTVDVISPLAWYAELLGLSKVGLREASPDNWNEIEGLRVWMMCIQILRYTWLPDSWDVIPHEYLEDADFPAFFIQEMDAIAQVRELVEGLAGRFVCQLNGRFEGQPRPELMPTNHRSNIDTTIVHGDPDIIDYEFQRLHRRPVNLVRTRGFRAGSTTSATKPLFGKWPGAAPGAGILTETVERLITTTTAEHYELSGKFGADADRIFVDSNGGVHHAPEGRLTLPYAAIYDPALCEWLAFDASMRANLRGVTLSTFRWIMTAMTLELGESGEPTTTLTIKAETDTAADGVDDTPPSEGGTGIGDIDWTPPSIDTGLPTVTPITPITPIVFGKDRLAMPLSNGHLARTFNADYASPTWADIDLSATLGATVLRWRYSALPTVRDCAGWLVTPTKVWFLDNVFGTPVLTEQLAFGTSSSYRSIDASWSYAPGLVVAIASYYTPTGGVKVTVSRDGGNTWASEVTVTSHVADVSSFGTVGSPGIAISSTVPGLMYVSAFSASAAAGDQRIYKSTDYGATWTLDYGDGGEDLAGNLHMPHHNNSAGNILYGGDSDYDSGALNDYRFPLFSTDGATETRIDTNAGPHFNRDFGTSSSPTNRLRMLFATTNRANTVHSIYTSTDGGTTRNLISAAGTYTQVALVDDNRALLWGPNGAIGFSADYCANIVSKIGNLVTTAEGVGVTS